MKPPAGAALAACLLAFPATGQVVGECDWRARADAIAEPWSEQSRTFADGAVRIALSDTGEPACCSATLIVLAPDDLGNRTCFLVHPGGTIGGWHGVDIAGTTASYDPARGLLLTVPVTDPDPLGGADPDGPHPIALRVNQAEGTVDLE